MGVNKVQYGNTTLIDITDTTATTSDVVSGKYFYGKDGVKTLGTATLNNVTQDENGFIVLPPDGGGSPSVGGLEYETGTWAPSEDVARGEIFFTNTHSDMPIFIMLTDVKEEYFDTLYSNLAFFYMDWDKAFGAPIYTGTSTRQYGLSYNRYRSSSATGTTASQNPFSSPSSSPYDDGTAYFRYYATNTKFMPYTGSTSRYWRAGRTYKWIAVWAPTV